MSEERRAVENYARRRMRQGDLLTWTFSRGDQVTFFIPEDVSAHSYPTEIEGFEVVIRRLPRPLRQGR